MIEVSAALRDLSDRQQWGHNHRAEAAGIPDAMDRLAVAMIAEPAVAVVVLEYCSDIDFTLAAQVFDDVAAVLGRTFVERVE